MRLPLLFRTAVFRLTLAYMALFALSVGALSAFIYWATLGYLESQTNATIEAEINGLYEQFERRSLNGLRNVIEERVARDTEGRSYYLLADAIGRPLAGNVTYWPIGVDDAHGQWVDFVQRDSDTPVRAMLLRVGPGLRLLVGRDIRELTAIRQMLRRASFYGITLTLGLALVGGVLLAVSAERRLAEINRTTRQIIAGDLTRRAPHRGTNDEHDELAQNINAMLDQIESLLAGMRHVGDSVAHDLRGPITRLRNRLETVAAAETPRREDLADCVVQLDQVLATFNALLRIARVESGAYRSAFTTVDLEPIVRDVGELYQAAAEERRVTLRCETRPVEVFGDRELLAQMLTNLVDNAIKYTPDGGVVTVGLERRGDTAQLRVADTGPGIPEADRSRVLHRFTRLDQARSQPGNGLGLALVNAVTSQHHGRLTLGDNSPGLVVTIELPALTPPRTAA
ncbi:MAG TPA: HAMP domain-containing sensor histidine kinase [Gammaproteobacteria bacterium]|nr:HAMP domain-containing sensor histidine kinase [Gammaproteobacteria bacterium]